MRFVDRILWLCLSLALTSCSLVTEFPEIGGDAGSVTGTTRDGSVGGSLVSCTGNADCDPDELCCDTGDGGGKRCQGTDPKTQCAACGQACSSDDQDLSCVDRVCECERGSEAKCGSGEFCARIGGVSQCVGCRSSADCANTAGRTACVDNQCEACDPGTNEGCQNPTPKCTAEKVCASCASDDDCPDGLSCNGALGCFGCKIGAPLSANNCPPATPVCSGSAAGPQCGGCKANADCPSAFCDETTERCHNDCDPRLVPGQEGNGCAKPEAPICKLDAAGAASCVGCTTGDICPNPTQMCSTIGPTLGQCVPMMSACTGATPVAGPGGACVECTNNTQCMGNPNGPLCSANKCGQCVPGTRAGNTACSALNPATPICSPTGCVARCPNSAACRAATPNTPICSGDDDYCMPCTAFRGNAACDDFRDAPVCVTSGAAQGSCAACNPGSSCVPRGSLLSTGFCGPAGASGALVCNECNPAATPACGGGGMCQLNATAGRFECVAPPPPPPTIPGIGSIFGQGVQRTVP